MKTRLFGLGRNLLLFFSAPTPKKPAGTPTALQPRNSACMQPLPTLQITAPAAPAAAPPPSHSGSHHPGFRLGLPLLIYPPTDVQRVARTLGQMGRRSIPDKPTLGAFR